MKLLIFALLFLLPSAVFSQKIDKSIPITKANIKEAGYSFETVKMNDNRIRYVRYDAFGEAFVTIDHQNEIVRMVSFVCPNPVDAAERWISVYKKTSTEDFRETVDKYPDSKDKIIATNTMYYSGKAVYRYKIDEVEKVDVFTIILID